MGYLLLGITLQAGRVGVIAKSGTVHLLAELGVVFLLFDSGLHFSLDRVRRSARDIFGFGPLQVAFGGLVLGVMARIAGLAVLPTFLLGTVLALSSTAVVAPLIAERQQQNCPVGLTAPAILVFQNLAAIFLLIVAGSLGGGRVLPEAGLALLKSITSFAVAQVFARAVVRPLLVLVARARQEEVFTAHALLIALSAGWATGKIGFSLTLAAFLGGITVAETPFRAMIESEMKPFRGLLLGFFFISVGISLDLTAFMRHWPVVIGVAAGLMAAKVVSNAAAARAFCWSSPGSVQLGFLLAQGSEFTFVVLSLPSVRALIGEARVSIVVAAVALSLAVAPNIAGIGRVLAGRLRRHDAAVANPELEQQDCAAPVPIVGMGRIGRTLAKGLTAFGIAYVAIERRLREAIADGYVAVFGDLSDLRLWQPVAIASRKIGVLTKTATRRRASGRRSCASSIRVSFDTRRQPTGTRPGGSRHSACARWSIAAFRWAWISRPRCWPSSPSRRRPSPAGCAGEQERALGRAGATPLAA